MNFDVTFDRLKLQFAGLTPSKPLDPKRLFPSTAIALARLSDTPGRVVVSIQQVGATFGPTPLTFENAEYTRPNPLTPLSFPIVNGPTLSYRPS